MLRNFSGYRASMARLISARCSPVVSPRQEYGASTSCSHTTRSAHQPPLWAQVPCPNPVPSRASSRAGGRRLLGADERVSTGGNPHVHRCLATPGIAPESKTSQPVRHASRRTPRLSPPKAAIACATLANTCLPERGCKRPKSGNARRCFPAPGPRQSSMCHQWREGEAFAARAGAAAQILAMCCGATLQRILMRSTRRVGHVLAEAPRAEGGAGFGVEELGFGRTPGAGSGNGLGLWDACVASTTCASEGGQLGGVNVGG